MLNAHKLPTHTHICIYLSSFSHIKYNEIEPRKHHTHVECNIHLLFSLKHHLERIRFDNKNLEALS